MSKIVIDGRMIGWTGIGRYTRCLLDELQNLDKDNHYIVLLLKRDFYKWEPSAKNFRKQAADFEPYSLDEQLLLPITLLKLRPDLVHFLSFNQPIFYFGLKITTIHDLTLIDYKNVRGGRVKRLLYELKYALMSLVLNSSATSRTIITDTEFVADSIRRRMGLARERVKSIHLAADQNLANPEPLDRLKLGDSPFIFYVGNSYPHKNLARLLDAMTELKSSHPDLKLVVAGKQDYFYDQLGALARELKLEDRVVFPGFVSDGELAALYEKAQAYVFPSLSEGFGLPALEAMQAGTPVLAAKASCLPEICGEAAVYFDPYSPADIAEKIDQLLNDKDEQKRLREAGPKHAETFSWHKTAEETLKVYKSVLSSPHTNPSSSRRRP